jgi:hypothetical protein
MKPAKEADSLAVDAVKAFLADHAIPLAREQRSPWISPWELAARLPQKDHVDPSLHPECVEAALQALSIPCVKICGARRYLLAPVYPASACLTPENLRPTEVAAGLKVSLAAASR